MHLWNVGLLQRDYTNLYPKRLYSSYSRLFKHALSTSKLFIVKLCERMIPHWGKQSWVACSTSRLHEKEKNPCILQESNPGSPAHTELLAVELSACSWRCLLPFSELQISVSTRRAGVRAVWGLQFESRVRSWIRGQTGTRSFGRGDSATNSSKNNRYRSRDSNCVPTGEVYKVTAASTSSVQHSMCVSFEAEARLYII
jgi:hypothetical protein